MEEDLEARDEGEMVPSEPEENGGETTAEKQWYYSRAGKSYGPVSEEQLKALARQGYFERDDYVYAAFIGDWVKAESVYGLFEGVGGEGIGGAVEAPPAEVGAFAAPAAAAPEGLRYYARYAGFWVRFLAVFIDGLVLAIPNCVVMGVIQAMLMRTMGRMAATGPQMFDNGATEALAAVGMMVIGNIAMMAVSWLYYSLMESSRWQATLGKRAVGIIVTDLAGRRISFGRATGRHWSSLLSGIIFSIGYLLAIFTERKQTLHDMIAGTVVVYGHTG